MPNEQPPVEWQGDQSEGTAPDDVNYVGPPGYTNSTLLDDLWLAIKRLYNCSVTHRCLSADLLDGKHGAYYGLYVAGTEVGTPNLVAGAGVDLSVSGSDITISVNTASLDHGALSGRDDDDHALYAKGDPDSSSTTGNLASFLNTDGRSLEDSGIAANNVTLNSDNLSNLENAADARANIGAGDVSASANMTDNTLLRGDGGAKGIQHSELTLSDLSASAITISTVTAATAITFQPKDATGNNNGGKVSIRAGNANTATGNGNGGVLELDGGSEGGLGGTEGAISIGTIYAGSVAIAKTGVVTTVKGETYMDDDLSLPKASGKGIKVDSEGTPTFPWHDMLGEISVRGTGGVDPSFNRYNGTTIRQFQFDPGEEVYVNFHIPHDYVPGTDIHLHFHWSQDETRTTGVSTNALTGGSVTWGAEHTYAKGHEQAAFAASKTFTVVGTPTVFTKAEHYITEGQLSAASPSAAQIDSDDIEPDGLILMRVYLSANNLVMAEEGTQCAPYLHQVDVHYQSTNIGTKDKAPNFYT